MVPTSHAKGNCAFAAGGLGEPVAAGAIEAHEALVRKLMDPARYPHPVQRVRLIETHISSVLLTGEYAYKLKKPLDLGFLDFSTLERRRFCCGEELRLNRRLAPDIYLEVVPIRGSADAPRFDGGGAPIEYAVKMREFAQEALLDGMLARGELLPAHVDAIAREVADFHRGIARAAPDSGFGSAASVTLPVEQNFAQIRPRLGSDEERAALAAIEDWSLQALRRLAPSFARRRRDGFVRECHGDLHLGNIALVDGAIQVFDCIEFNPNLRWIDVISEIAFLVMDLAERGRADYAWRFLDAYLQQTGDYGGLAMLDFYRVYRAMVRAKVARIRASQEHLTAQARAAALASYEAYLRYARRCMALPAPALIITHGLSGSGKTAVSQALLEGSGAVRVRSDVERKRLRHLPGHARSGSGIDSGIYSEAATRETYEELARLARLILESGHTAIMDAAFLQRWQRDLLRRTASAVDVPFVIVDCRAGEVVLRQRLARREQAGSDASEATVEVLERQRASADPLDGDELTCCVAIDTERAPPVETLLRLNEAIRRRSR